jgi:glycosyltransferase involved in cell wall biosynthesis
MKILFYSGHPTLSLHAQTGYGTHMREMIRAFEEAGHEVHVFVQGQWLGRDWSKERPSSEANTMKSQGLKHILPPLFWETARDAALLLRDYRLKRELASYVRAVQPDVIYERNHLGMLSGVHVARKYGIHHVLEVNSPNVEERIELSGPSLLNRVNRFRDRKALKLTNHVITVSRTLGMAIGLPALNANWSVAPNAIRPGQESLSTLQLTRTALGLPEQAFVVGFVGSIFPWHGVDLIVDAVCALREAGHDVAALIVGDGQIKTDLKARAADRGASDAFIWTGTVEHLDTFAYARLADCLVLPQSHSYGSPIKIFEYALAGRPVIAPKNGPVSEVMENGVHGWLVDPQVEQLCDSVLNLLNDDEWASRMSRAWLSRVLEHHTWVKNASQALSNIANK